MKHISLFNNAISKISLKPISFWFFLLALTMAEILVVYSLSWIGIICYWLVLMYCTLQPLLNNKLESRDFLLGLSLIPLIRIISISLPLTKLPQIWWYPLIYIPLLAASIIVMHVTGLKAADIGFIRKKIHLQIPLGILAGLVLGTIEYIILRPQALESDFTFQSVWLPALVLFITTGVVEEIIFRGVLQRFAVPLMGFLGMVYVSIVFAILHFGFYSSWDILFVFLVAMLFAMVIRKTGSIWGLIFAHGTTNIVLFTVAPFILGQNFGNF
jgi:uncharacterized protein